MSWPLSAWRAIDSADTVRFVLEVVFIKLLFHASRFPQSHEAIVFSAFICPDFKNQRIESPTRPPDGTILLRPILTLIEMIRMTKYLLRFLETNTALRILSESSALLLIKLEAHGRTL